MKNLKTSFNGGFPFKLDDIRFLQECYEERIGMFFKDIIWPMPEQFENPTPNTFIVQGVKMLSSSSTSATWSEGIVSIDGVLYTLDAGSVTFSYPTTAPFILADSPAFYPAGNKTFENATTHDTYELRKAKVQALTIYSGTLVVQDHLYLGSKRRFSWGNYPAYEISLGSGFLVNSVIPGQTIRCYQDSNGEVKFTGSIKVPVSFGGQGMLLPVAARPSVVQAFVLCNTSQDPGLGLALCIVHPDGKVYIQPYDNTLSFSGDEDFNLASIKIVKGL